MDAVGAAATDAGGRERSPAPDACAHCGLPLARAGADYCCAGCRVAHALAGSSLEHGDRVLGRLLLAGALAMGVMVFSLSLYGEHLWGAATDKLEPEQLDAVRGLLRAAALALSLPVVLLVGVPIADAVVRGRRVLSADGLILVGVASALALSVWNTTRGTGDVYFDTATAVLVLVAAGRWLEARARTKGAERLRALLPASEPPALRVEPHGFDEHEVEPQALCVGDLVRVRPGGVLPVDGVVVDGRAFVDTAALTGESKPRAAAPGSAVLAGSIALDGTLVVRATSTGAERLRERFARLLDEGLRSRAGSVRLADRVSAWLVPLVVVLGGATFAWRAPLVGAERALLDALSVALIACPCALGLATPLVMTFALSEAWRRGVLVRGGDVLERLARTRVFAFDKTGTLTTGELELEALHARDGCSERRALALAAALEEHSEHPVARALRDAARAAGARPAGAVREFSVLPGRGVRGTVDGRVYELVACPSPSSALTSVALWSDDVQYARYDLASSLRHETPTVLARLRALGIECRVLTGDARGPALELERELGLPVEHSLSPEQKLARVRELAAASSTVYVGDGLNDSGALAAAGVGISMARGVGASLEAAHVHLVRDGLSELPELVRLARRAVAAARLNLAWAFAYNGIGLYLAATGRLSPVFAASAMVASSAFVAWNASRVGTSGDAAPMPQRAATVEPPASGVAAEPMRARAASQSSPLAS